MDRRTFLARSGAATVAMVSSPLRALASGYDNRLLMLIELKGGNDGLNTVVPYADPNYTRLRPQLSIPREQVLPLDERIGLHPSLEPLLALWRAGELALVQGVGYPEPNLSHFRSIEIWDTASDSRETLRDGWLGRVFSRHPAPRAYAADGVVIGSHELGPMAGGAARPITLNSMERFERQARYARVRPPAGNAALDHVIKVERDIAAAAASLARAPEPSADYPRGEFGNNLRTACRVLASADVAAMRLTLNGFDTHQNQAGVHASLLDQLAQGIIALRSVLQALGKWDSTLLLTYSEFGRRAGENASRGTDHGTASVVFASGGRVTGGLYGAAPRLDRLDGNGNLAHGVDFRRVYASVLERWWGLPAGDVLGRRFAPVGFLRA